MGNMADKSTLLGFTEMMGQDMELTEAGERIPWDQTQLDPYWGHETPPDPGVGEEMDFDANNSYTNPTYFD
jgi:hypothetical protein